MLNKKLLLKRLNDLRIKHYECQDDGYSCPKTSFWRKDAECDCGADEHNSKIDKLIEDIFKDGNDTIYVLGILNK